MYNKVTLIGNLGKDPELKTFDSGTTNCKFSLATSSSYKKNDEWEQDTQWHNITLWGKAAERAAEKLYKGARVLIEGKVTYRSWDDQDGNKKYMTEIQANFYRLMDKREESEPTISEAEVVSEPSSEMSKPKDDDLPFF